MDRAPGLKNMREDRAGESNDSPEIQAWDQKIVKKAEHGSLSKLISHTHTHAYIYIYPKNYLRIYTDFKNGPVRPQNGEFLPSKCKGNIRHPRLLVFLLLFFSLVQEGRNQHIQNVSIHGSTSLCYNENKSLSCAIMEIFFLLQTNYIIHCSLD